LKGEEIIMLFVRFIAISILIGIVFQPPISAFQNKRRTIRKTVPKPTPTPTPTPVPLSTLSIDVGLVMSNGGVRKIARNKFSLITKDIGDALNELGYVYNRSFPNGTAKFFISGEYNISDSSPKEGSRRAC
jgi:hypothetical protein